MYYYLLDMRHFALRDEYIYIEKNAKFVRHTAVADRTYILIFLFEIIVINSLKTFFP